jgi:recombination protein RecT
MEQKKNDLKTVSGFSATIVNYKNSIAKFLNPRYGITPEDFIETCIRAVKENPKLLQCDPKSLFGAVLLSAEVGLKPNTSLQHSYIIPYKGEAKFQIGYKGLIEIMYRNSRVKQITARAVYENDFFEYSYGLKPDLIHKPARTDRGKLQCVYASCLVDNEPVFVVVEKAELDTIRGFSKAIDSSFSPYNNGTDIHNWMEIKAGVKALSKLIPTSNNIEMAKAVEYDSRFEGGARVMVELPSNPNDVVEPKLVDSNIYHKTLDTAFDIVDELTIEEPVKEIINTPNNVNVVKEHLNIVKEQNNSTLNHSKSVDNESENTIKEHSNENKKDSFEWDLNLSEKRLSEMDNDFSEKNNNNLSDDDIRFDFPSNDDEEEDGWINEDEE